MFGPRTPSNLSRLAILCIVCKEMKGQDFDFQVVVRRVEEIMADPVLIEEYRNKVDNNQESESDTDY
jgi:hypothetical protein